MEEDRTCTNSLICSYSSQHFSNNRPEKLLVSVHDTECYYWHNEALLLAINHLDCQQIVYLSSLSSYVDVSPLCYTAEADRLSGYRMDRKSAETSVEASAPQKVSLKSRPESRHCFVICTSAQLAENQLTRTYEVS